MINNKVKGYFALIGKLKGEDGKRETEQVKAVREYKKEVIKKMERLAQLFKVYKALKEVE